MSLQKIPRNFLIFLFLFISISCDLKDIAVGNNYYTVTRIIDGDTFVVHDGTKKGRKIRLIVILEYDVQLTDRYGRTLAYAYLPDSTFINAELVKQGFAQIATFPPNIKYVDLLLKLQQEAKNDNRGLWGCYE